MSARSCDSCGSDTDELWAVHRIYVTPEQWDQPGSERELDETEAWCVACVTHYPHRLLGPA